MLRRELLCLIIMSHRTSNTTYYTVYMLYVCTCVYLYFHCWNVRRGSSVVKKTVVKASSSKCQSREAHQKRASVLVILNACDCMPLACSCVQDYPSIMVVGHSLGGGVASIIALLLRTYFSEHIRGRNVQCFAFSPPGCVFRYVRVFKSTFVCVYIQYVYICVYVCVSI